MGLDMYAYRTRQQLAPVDFSCLDDAEEIAYWRKHPNLHGWMHQLYNAKGGRDERFNCNQLQLDSYDLDALEAAVTADALEHCTGFFFGESLPEDKTDDLAFIAIARKALAEGFQVYYTSWW